MTTVVLRGALIEGVADARDSGPLPPQARMVDHAFGLEEADQFVVLGRIAHAMGEHVHARLRTARNISDIENTGRVFLNGGRA
jgi:hypothetical protein